MARQGRCNAILAVAVLLVSYAAVALGMTYTVGDAAGWAIPGTDGTSATYLTDWTANKTFAAGDVVVFKYTPPGHSVLSVTEAAYTACTLASPLLKSTTGNDSLTLVAGPNYYICGIAGHCSGGQKVKITAGTAAATPPTAGTPPATPTTPTGTNNAAGTAVSVFYVLAAVVVAAVAFW